MPTTIFVSYPTADVERSTAFYVAIGATINEQFSSESGVCLAWDENIFFMLVDRETMASFIEKQIVDPRTAAQVQSAFTVDAREDVDRILAAGLAAGGTEHGEAQDHGFMYMRDLEDPDGNVIAFMWMAPEAAEQGPEAYAANQAQA